MGRTGVVSVTFPAAVTKNPWGREGVESPARGRGQGALQPHDQPKGRHGGPVTGPPREAISYNGQDPEP